MEVEEKIRSLRKYLAQLNFVIAELERMRITSPPSRRGRKSMGAEERGRVSTRMRQYWAGRRARAKGRLGTRLRPLGNPKLLLQGRCTSVLSDKYVE